MSTAHAWGPSRSRMLIAEAAVIGVLTAVLRGRGGEAEDGAVTR